MAGGLFSSVRQSLAGALGHFTRPVSDPTQVEGGTVLAQRPSYALLWAYYTNEAFAHMGMWGPYKGRYRLYRQMRLLYNPTRRLCDFYAGHVYPGQLTADPAALRPGRQIAVPLADDTTADVRAALDQLWAWSRWAVNQRVLVRYGAVAGNVLVEVVDDVAASAVYLNVIWPSLVVALDLDPTGLVLSYALEYPARDDAGRAYTYRKEVDRDQIRFFRDGMPHDYGEGAGYANPYGFVPAVWAKHRDNGQNIGEPAIGGSIGKIDELNSLASHIHDQIHKVIGAPLVLWTDGAVGNLFGAPAQTKRAPTTAYDTTDLDREGLLLLKGPAGGKADSLAGQLQLKEAAEHLTMLLSEIEHDHPEVVMYQQLRSMSQVTGPAAQRLLGDVESLVDEAAANYDAACAHLFAMALAIGGWRQRRGDWPEGGAAQRLFAPFDLAQYTGGDLRVSILPRPLIPVSEAEELELQQLRDTVKAGTPVTLAGNLRESIPE